jgi:hypothetical protein
MIDGATDLMSMIYGMRSRGRRPAKRAGRIQWLEQATGPRVPTSRPLPGYSRRARRVTDGFMRVLAYIKLCCEMVRGLPEELETPDGYPAPAKVREMHVAYPSHW